MSILYNCDRNLRERAAECLADDFKHEAIKTAQEVFYNKRRALVAEMPDWEGLRTAAADIRQHVTDNLDYYVREFAVNAQAAGNIVHFAPTAADALDEILGIFESVDAKTAVKSKSMMTEEMGLNEALEKAGYRVIETDCAENILQTAEDHPSHIVVPALHFDRTAIAELYQCKCGYDGCNVPEKITHFLRRYLRDEFLSADIGIRGCNFAVAETGSTTLVTNEGNGRMVDTCPRTQIVVVGIDRIVPDLASLDVVTALLARSAVGSKMTAYFSLDTGAARPGEADGPETVHIVIMDNRRHTLIGSDFEPMLRCIRCGACLNICPVYRHITGHGYGSIYPGPMGVVLTSAFEDYKNLGGLPYACTLCGACDVDCPVQVPLHSLIRRHRVHAVEQGVVHKSEQKIFKLAVNTLANPAKYRRRMKLGSTGMKMISHGQGHLDARAAWVPVLKGWTGSRDIDLVRKERFCDWFAQHKAEGACGCGCDGTEGEE